jgi:hypothetical protein
MLIPHVCLAVGDQKVGILGVPDARLYFHNLGHVPKLVGGPVQLHGTQRCLSHIQPW